jgi:malonyl-CoA/methylmalonyl-CoA synthetase
MTGARAELLIDRGLRRPAAAAAVDGAGVTTYRELDAASGRVAAFLLDGGRDLAEARVAYLVGPGRDHVAIQWGIWRAGGIAVPLALSHPEPELAFLLDDARPTTVIAGPEFVDRLDAIARARGIRIASGAAALATGSYRPRDLAASWCPVCVGTGGPSLTRTPGTTPRSLCFASRLPKARRERYGCSPLIRPR